MPTAQSPVVAIIAAGEMGSAVAQRLVETGVKVMTSLAGRSARSEERSRKAGMIGVDDDLALVTESGLMLSIVPPGEAVALADRMADAVRRAGKPFLYVDCNAIAPQTMERVTAIMEAAGAAVVDAGIIGGPPKPGGPSPRFYASGDHRAAASFAALGPHGLDIRVIGNEIGRASALKMCYGALTKGLTALGTELLVAARLAGVAEALSAEVEASQKPIVDWLERQIPAMPPKAYRWVAEMDEIALMFRGLGLPGTAHAGAGQLYRLIAGSPAASDSKKPGSLEEVRSGLAEHIRRRKQAAE